jgi:hypothetical protein
LEQDIKKAQINPLAGGGYYKIERVKVDEESKLYCDIYILTESIKNKKHIEQLALANEKRLAQLASVKSG